MTRDEVALVKSIAREIVKEEVERAIADLKAQQAAVDKPKALKAAPAPHK